MVPEIVRTSLHPDEPRKLMPSRSSTQCRSMYSNSTEKMGHSANPLGLQSMTRQQVVSIPLLIYPVQFEVPHYLS